jgi:hypothetical protein
MANMQTSPEFSFPITDLTLQYEELIKARPTILQFISVGSPATHTKTEWFEDVLSETSYAITALGTDGNGTSFTFASTAGLKVGMIVKFEQSTGASRAGLAKITDVNVNGTAITISRNYASMNTATLAVGDKLYIVSYPRAENSSAETDANREMTKNYNYTEISDFAFNLSNTALAVNNYGNANTIEYQTRQHLLKLLWKENRMFMYQGRQERTGGENGTMGGFEFFTQGGLTETTAGAVTSAHINNALDKLFNSSGIVGTNLGLVMNTNQARRISAFNTAGANPIVMVDNESRSTGRYISQFVGDLPVQNGFTAPIIVEPNMPKDQIWVMDFDTMERAYLRTPQLQDVSLASQDGRTYRMLMEHTARFWNGKERNVKITGLTI